MQMFVTSSPALGFNYVWRGGIAWPKDGMMVFVDEKIQDDPAADKQPKDAPRVIGSKTWKALKGDSRIFARPAGDIEDIAKTSAALAAANARIAELESDVKALKEERGEMQTEMTGLRAKLADAKAKPEKPAEKAPTADAKPKG